MNLVTPKIGRARWGTDPKMYDTRQWDQRLNDYRNAILEREWHQVHMHKDSQTYTPERLRELSDLVHDLHHELIEDMAAASDPSWDDAA